MKLHNLIAVLGVALLPALAHAQEPVLDQTSTQEWNVGRNITLTGEVATGSSVNNVLGDNTVSRYLGTGDLVRVVIKVLQPAPSESPLINASISLASGSTTFTSSTNNKITERTLLPGADFSVSGALSTYGKSIGDYNFLKESATYNGVTLSNPNTLTRSVDVTQSAITLFDSNTGGAMSIAALNEIFRDGDDIGFSYDITTTFRFLRDNTNTLNANLVGLNTGQVVVEYYIIPEPSTALLVAGAGLVGFLGRRRRSAR